MTTRRTAPAATRNLAPILQALQQHAPHSGRALEIASGSGQQIIHFAKAHPGLTWQASDFDPENLASITAWAQFAPSANLLPPIVLDGAKPGWAQEHANQSMILMVNLLHLISSPAATTLLHECSAALAPNGRLLIYGPFLRDGCATSPGDRQFDADLRARDPAIGYKDLSWVQAELASHSLHPQINDMPANNLLLIAQRP